jgi:hypothetical protein
VPEFRVARWFVRSVIDPPRLSYPLLCDGQVTPIIWLLALMQPLNGFVNVGAGVLQGAQDFAYQV